jgi:hypothetical protein
VIRISRSHYRNWRPIDHRYDYYTWPREISAKCKFCEGMILFSTDEQQSFSQEAPGIYRVSKLPTSAYIHGRGICTSCKKITSSISWPDDAYYSVKLASGNVWAWNQDYLRILQAYIAGQRSDVSLSKDRAMYLYFLARLPKYAVLKRNRGPLLKKINSLLSARAA